MKLRVCVLEAQGLPFDDGETGKYAKLKLGKKKIAKTKTVRGRQSIVWNEEFHFTVNDDDDLDSNSDADELFVGVYRADEGFFGPGGGEIIGRVCVPIVVALHSEGKQLNMTPTWFTLLSRHGGGAKDCGKILLTLSLYVGSSDQGQSHISNHQTGYERLEQSASPRHKGKKTGFLTETLEKTTFASDKNKSIQGLASHLVKRLLRKKREDTSDISEEHDLAFLSDTSYSGGSDIDKSLESLDFEEAIENLQSVDENDMPEDLQGGVLLDENYLIEPKVLNSFLYEPDSQFRRHLAEQEGVIDYREGPWTLKYEDNTPSLRRSVNYTKGATKLVKAIRASEEQIYLKADGKCFAVLTRVQTPDVPYGNSFEVNLLCKIMPGPELHSGEQTSHLVMSWKINFHQSTMMKSIIEGGTRQGLKESYENFAALLAQNVKRVNSEELPLNKEHALAPLQQESEWELAIKYFLNFTFIFIVFAIIYTLLHIIFSGPSKITGLEFFGLDLPDTFGELITSGMLVLQGRRVFNMISHFAQARLRRGMNHGVEAQVDGWLLTVALVEGTNLPSTSASGWIDPYVVLRCNGQTRTSSVQLQTLDPRWNDILEFDAMQEPPSVLDVEVYDFDGPFDQSASLGHAEINFLKHSSAELADMWITLEGKLAQASRSRVHVRIFLENTKGVETMREYLKKMEKEVGRKLKPRSPHRNSFFPKLFNLPPEEFLIKDFACYLRRKIPLQGRLFLSARVVGFYSNLFGRKTKFFFLWEDIDDIRVLSPSLATVGSPALLIILKKGRGHDARNGAKSLDEEGRLRFQFQAFGSFNIASRTIIALWKKRTLTSAENIEAEDDQGEQSEHQSDEGGSSDVDESGLAKEFSTELSLPIESLMEVFGGRQIEKKIMEKVGCFNYLATPWRPLNSNGSERQVHYNFTRPSSIFGGEVTSTQQKTKIQGLDGWIIDEVMTLHNVPYGDYFQINVTYKFEPSPSSSGRSHCEVNVSVTWLRSNKFQKRITHNLCDKLTHRAREMFQLAEKEFISTGMKDTDFGKSLSRSFIFGKS